MIFIIVLYKLTCKFRGRSLLFRKLHFSLNAAKLPNVLIRRWLPRSCLVSVYESTMKVNNCLQNCCFFGESCKMFPSDLKITQDSPAGNGLTILKQNHCDDRWDRRSPECCSRGYLDSHGKVDTCFRSGLESWLQFISFVLCSIIHQKY